MSIVLIRRSHLLSLIGASVVAVGGLTATAEADRTVVERGRLDSGDEQLGSEEYFDRISFDVPITGRLDVRMYAEGFDGYLILQPPGFAESREGQLDNDDWEGDLGLSRIIVEDAAPGRWTVLATSAFKEITGAYRIEATIPGTGAPTGDVVRGELSATDPRLAKGEYYDVIPIELSDGERIVATLDTPAFDGYLALNDPLGTPQAYNDDFEGSETRSQIEHVATSGGSWSLIVTTYAGNITGSYELRIDRKGGASAGANRIAGSLAAGDEKTDGGAFADVYTLQGTPGETLTIDLISTNFDTLLGVYSNDAFLGQNDDHEGRTDQSRMQITVPADGTYIVLVTSYAADQTGDYEVVVTSGGAAAGGSNTETIEDMVTGARNVEVLRERGELAPGDRTLDNNEFFDSYDVEASVGETLDVTMNTAEFDAYLVLVGPDEEMVQNDDIEADVNLNSRIVHPVTVSGTHVVVATSARAKETGVYEVAVRSSTGGSANSAPAIAPVVVQGTLEATDPTLQNGEHYDLHDIEATAGTGYSVELDGIDFDPYLIMIDPNDETREDDDGGEGVNSRLVFEAHQTGTYRIVMTSLAPAQTGSYQLKITQLTGSAAPNSGGGGGNEIASGLPNLPLNGEVRGTLQQGDSTLPNEEFADSWAFEATAGQTVAFELASSAFDTYLALVDPDMNILQNDDHDGSHDASRIEFTVAQSGTHVVIATSYRAGETGDYALRAVPVAGGGAVAGNTGGRIFGVFVGMSDYPGEDSDLPLCDKDAVDFQRALLEHTSMTAADSVLLINREARRDTVSQAIQDMGSRVGPNDTFVFFFSGHGNRVKRQNMLERDPDGHDALDETLVLYDGNLLDDEMDVLLNAASAGTSLIVLDSCFSGGFSKDVISRPGRMGLFSSHEDVTSATAAKFQAGGYLAVFVAEAVGDSAFIADENRDGSISSAELSQFVYEGYRNELVRNKSSDFLDITENLGYQQLIVDRGGVSVHHALFQLSGN